VVGLDAAHKVGRGLRHLFHEDEERLLKVGADGSALRLRLLFGGLLHRLAQVLLGILDVALALALACSLGVLVIALKERTHELVVTETQGANHINRQRVTVAVQKAVGLVLDLAGVVQNAELELVAAGPLVVLVLPKLGVQLFRHALVVALGHARL
jgi:hypothetical protein